MSTPIVEGVNTIETGDETRSLSAHEVEDVNSATRNSSTPVMFEEGAGQIKAATDPLTRQLQRLCDEKSSNRPFRLVMKKPVA